MQNLFGSHDSNRLASFIVNRNLGKYGEWGSFFNISKAADNRNYKVRKPDIEERRMGKMFNIFQMTYVGAPMIYYGDEVGMWGANDPDCRKPMIWDDIEYDPEVFNPDGSARTPDRVEVDTALKDHYKTLIAIRNAHKALQYGGYRTLMADDSTNIFAFERKWEKEILIIIINNSPEDQEISLKQLDGYVWEGLLNGAVYDFTENKGEISIPYKWGLILKKKS